MRCKTDATVCDCMKCVSTAIVFNCTASTPPDRSWKVPGSIVESATLTMNQAGQQYNVNYYQQRYKSQTELTCSYDLDLDPMTLIYGNDLEDSEDAPVPVNQK